MPLKCFFLFFFCSGLHMSRWYHWID